MADSEAPSVSQNVTETKEATGNACQNSPVDNSSSPATETAVTTTAAETAAPAPETPAHVTEAEQLYKKLTSATESRSLLRKHLTQAIFDKVKNRKTSLGGTLAHCIRSDAQEVVKSRCLLLAMGKSLSLVKRSFNRELDVLGPSGHLYQMPKKRSSHLEA